MDEDIVSGRKKRTLQKKKNIPNGISYNVRTGIKRVPGMKGKVFDLVKIESAKTSDAHDWKHGKVVMQDSVDFTTALDPEETFFVEQKKLLVNASNAKNHLIQQHNKIIDQPHLLQQDKKFCTWLERVRTPEEKKADDLKEAEKEARLKNLKRKRKPKPIILDIRFGHKKWMDHEQKVQLLKEYDEVMQGSAKYKEKVVKLHAQHCALVDEFLATPEFEELLESKLKDIPGKNGVYGVPDLQEWLDVYVLDERQRRYRDLVAKNEIHRSISRGKAVKRLWRDLRELKLNPMAGVVADAVMGNNFFEWHCNVKGAPNTIYAGTVFHMEIQFPDFYPVQPPRVILKSSLWHPNVYGSWICLDMLYHDSQSFWPDGDEVRREKAKHYGWTSAYSVQSILLQLQSFFMDKAHVFKELLTEEQWRKSKLSHGIHSSQKEEEYKYYKRGVNRHNSTVNNSIYAARRAKCVCGHKGSHPYPAFPTQKELYLRSGAKMKNDARAAAVNAARLDNKTKSSVPVPVAGRTVVTKSKKNTVHSASSSSSCSSSSSSSAASILARLGVGKGSSAKSAMQTQKRGKRAPRLTAQQARALVPGSKLTGIVTRLEDYGAFVDVGWRRAGMVHISQFGTYANQIDDVVSRGDVLTVYVRELDHQKLKLSLSTIPPSKEDQAETAAEDTNDLEPADGEKVEEVAKEVVEPKERGVQAKNTTTGPQATTKSKNKKRSGKRSADVPKTNIAALRVGDELNAIVRNMSYTSAFVDVGAERNAMLLVESIRRQRYEATGQIIWEPSEIFKERQMIRVRVEKVNVEKQQIRVSLLSDVVIRDKSEVKENKSPKPRPSPWLALDKSQVGRVSADIHNLILGFLTRRDLRDLATVSRHFRIMTHAALAVYHTRQELLCYHTKVPFTENTVGIGCTIQYYENNGDVSNIVPNFSMVSGKAFHEEKIRQGWWKDDFTHWLPLYINKLHSQDLVICEKAIANMCRNKYSKVKELYLNPLMALKILPAMMNTLVVEIMQGELHESIVAMQGYLSFLHMLLAFMQKYPELQRSVDKRIEDFVADEYGRKKRNCPNLGEWIACLAVSNYSWEDVCIPYLTENFDRNVKWVIIKYPELVDLDFRPPPMTKVEDSTINILKKLGVKKALPTTSLETKDNLLGDDEDSLESRRAQREVNQTYASIDKGRLPKTWTATLTSCRLLMFHVMFLRIFRYKKGKFQSVQATKDMLDRYLGRSTHRMQMEMQAGIKSIKKVTTWDEFFERIGIPAPSHAYLVDWLQQSSRNSARKRYHDPVAVAEELERMKREAMGIKEGKKRKKAKALEGMAGDDGGAFDDIEAQFADVGGSRSSRW